MGEREIGRLAPARRPLQKTLLDQEGFVYVLERPRLLADDDRDRGEPDWTTAVLHDERIEHPPVQVVEPARVDLEEPQRRLGHLFGDLPLGPRLGVIAHAA